VTKGVDVEAGGHEERRYQTGKHLEAFLLLLLCERPDHGGQLLDRLATFLPPAWSVDSGRVYRILRDLEGEGALASHWVFEGSGAPVRVYELTDVGRKRLDAWQEEIRLRRASFDRFLAKWSELRGDGRA
jgi:PadR family transcriptional regulator PadR